MSDKLTLSVIVPEYKIRKSLPLALVDLDSHINSLRYKSFEIIIVSGEEGRGSDVVENFKEVMPNVVHAGNDGWEEKVRGKNILIINSELGISYPKIKKVKQFFKADDRFVILSPKKDGRRQSFLDKATDLLVEILEFDFEDYPAHPYLTYMERDLIESYPALNPEGSFVRFSLGGDNVNIQQTENEGVSTLSYLKLWRHMIIEKIKIIFKNLKSRFKNKAKSNA